MIFSSKNGFQNMNNLILLLDSAIIAIVLFVIWFINRGKEQKILVKLAKKWNLIPAQLVSCVLEKIRSTTSNNKGFQYKVKVLYKYKIDLTEYEGSLVCFNYIETFDNQHEKLYKNLHKVNHINIWVNPNNFAESVLINHNFEKLDKFLQKVGLFFLVTVVFVIIYSISGYFYDIHLVNQILK